MKQSLTLLFLLLGLSNLSGQYIFNGNLIGTCNATFSDSGGPNNDYSANETIEGLICPDLSTGTHIRLNLAKIDLGAGDSLCFYDGIDTNAPLLDCLTPPLLFNNLLVQATAANTTGCLLLRFVSDAVDQGSGWEAFISCEPACQRIEAELVTTNPPVLPSPGDWIDICPGEEVTFEARGSYLQSGQFYEQSDDRSVFRWNFGDGNLAEGTTVSHTFEEPGGYYVQLIIQDSFGCSNTELLSQRVRVSTRPDFELAGDLPPFVCVGDTLELAALVGNTDPNFEVSVQGTEGSFQTEGTRYESLDLPDGDGASYETSVTLAGFAPGQVLTDINDLQSICVNMEHSYLFDLEVTLICPNGKELTLVQQTSIQTEVFLGQPFEGDDFNTPDPPAPGVGFDYCWTPNANNSTWTVYASSQQPGTLPAGDYAAHEAFSELLGCPLNGEWTLRVTDLWVEDNGWIFNWSINFDPALFTAEETFTPAIAQYQWGNHNNLIAQFNDSIAGVPNNAGAVQYQFMLTDAFGCDYDTLVQIPTLPPTHPDCFSCADALNDLRDTSICDGDLVFVDAAASNALNAEDITFDAFPNYDFNGINHPTTNAYAAALEINSLAANMLSDPYDQIRSVCINLEHTDLSQVEVSLQAPAGQILFLSTGNGQAGDAYAQTCFSPTATTPIANATAPFTGSYGAEGDWTVLQNSPVNGTWHLLITDNSGNDLGGRIQDWSITFQNEVETIYSWSPNNGLSCDDCPDPIINTDVTTLYQIEYNDSYNCQQVENIEVEVQSRFPAPNVQCGLGAPDALLFEWPAINGAMGYEVSLDGGTTWLTPSSPTAHLVSGLNVGEDINLQVRAISNNLRCESEIATASCRFEGCMMMIDTSMTTPPSCYDTNDGTIIMTQTGGLSPISYFADGAGPFTALINGVDAEENEIIAIDAMGCSDTIYVTIPNSPDSIDVEFVELPVNCFNGMDGALTAVASGGQGPYNYVWGTTPTSNGPILSNIGAGNYAVTVFDANFCIKVDIGSLENPSLLAAFTDADSVTCNGGSDGQAVITPLGGTSPYTYQWSNGATDSIINNVEADLYTVIVTDSRSCSDVFLVDVGEPEAVLVQATQTVFGCFGEQSSEAIAMGMGGTPPYTYEWSNGATTAAVTGLDSILYSVTVTDAEGCSFTELLPISEMLPIEASLFVSDVSCFGAADGSLAIMDVSGGSGNGSLGDYSYTWLTDPVQNSLIIANLSGDTTYSLIVTDDQNCADTFSVFLEEPSEILVTLETTNASCNGLPDGQAEVTSATGDFDVFTYQWDFNTGNQTTPLADSLMAGMYGVVVTDSSGCSVDTTVVIGHPDVLELSFEVEENSCPNDSAGVINTIVMGGTPGYSFQWSNASQSPTLNDLPAGWYFLTLTDQEGCAKVDSVLLENPDGLSIRADGPILDCRGDQDGQIIVQAMGGLPPYQYSLGGEIFGSASNFLNLTAGTYDIFVVDAQGCEAYDDVTILEPFPFLLDAGPDLEMFLGDSLQLDVDIINGAGDIQISWIAPYEGTLSCPPFQPNCLNPWSTALSTITYEVYGVDENGCE
ncbi:MAG: proprotein convertase P-domain-containing protein, partial [Bacteroidota bacterium]